MLAANSGHAEAVRLLLGAGARARDKDREGHDALELARANGHESAARAIEEYVAAERQSGHVAPSGWGKVRRLSAAAQAAGAFASKGQTQLHFAALLEGRATIGASTLSWLNNLVRKTEQTASSLMCARTLRAPPCPSPLLPVPPPLAPP